MKSLEPATTMDMLEELQIWREATTVFMLAGHGGCSPFGLALSAWKRGFKVQLYASSDEVPFVDSVRDKEKKRSSARSIMILLTRLSKPI